MDILSHTFSGVAAVSASLPFTNFDWKQKIGVLVLGAFVGAFPDLDAVSLWSGFGQVGKDIYFSKHWYSHHGFNHSISAGLLLVLITTFFRTKRFKDINKNERVISLGLLIGFCAHLLEDMPTPYCVWGGIRLFFPIETYVGGYGKIWWWNNYDIFLLILLITVFNLIIATAIRKEQYKKIGVVLSSSLFVGMIVFQMNTRKVDYNYEGFSVDYYKYEQQSKDEQKRILGTKIYTWMEALDRKIPLNF